MGSIDSIIGNELAFRPFPGNQEVGLELMSSWGPTLITSSNIKYIPKPPPPQTTNMGIGVFSFHHVNFFGGTYKPQLISLPSNDDCYEHHMSKKYISVA